MGGRALALGLVVLACGCSALPQDADPRYWWRNLSGGYLDGREPPPGRDAPYPNLATVPARPVPPDAATRAAITAGLAADRRGAQDGLVIAPAGGSGAAAGGAGQALRPPAPARLAAVPRIRLDPLPVEPAANAAPGLAPNAGPNGIREAGPDSAAGRASPSALSGPPGAPPAELLAPPRPASPALSGPPAPPSSDLLAPRRN